MGRLCPLLSAATAAGGVSSVANICLLAVQL
jgi:hypothetical protein